MTSLEIPEQKGKQLFLVDLLSLPTVYLCQGSGLLGILTNRPNALDPAGVKDKRTEGTNVWHSSLKETAVHKNAHTHTLTFPHTCTHIILRERQDKETNGNVTRQRGV